MSISAIAPVAASSDSLNTLVGLSSASSSVAVSTSASTSASTSTTTAATTAVAASIVANTPTASAILATVSIPSGASQASPPLSTDTLQLLQDLSTGDFTAAKSDVAKVQEDLQTRQAASSTSTASDSSLTKQLTSLKESLEAGKTSDALSILTGLIAQSGNTSGSFVNTSA